MQDEYYRTAYLGTSNTKLKKSRENGNMILSWSLPAGDTCINAGACRRICYAKKGNFLYENVRNAHIKNYKLSLSDEFVSVIVAEVQKYARMYKNLYVRIHDAGDFYSEEYFDKWVSIALACPDVIFYGYTKMIRMLNSKRYDIPFNMTVIQSYGGTEDKSIDKKYCHAIVVKTADDVPEGYCVANDDDLTWEKTVCIALVYHGSKNMITEMR
jgi:ferredoxin